LATLSSLTVTKSLRLNLVTGYAVLCGLIALPLAAAHKLIPSSLSALLTAILALVFLERRVWQRPKEEISTRGNDENTEPYENTEPTNKQFFNLNAPLAPEGTKPSSSSMDISRRQDSSSVVTIDSPVTSTNVNVSVGDGVKPLTIKSARLQPQPPAGVILPGEPSRAEMVSVVEVEEPSSEIEHKEAISSDDSTIDKALCAVRQDPESMASKPPRVDSPPLEFDPPLAVVSKSTVIVEPWPISERKFSALRAVGQETSSSIYTLCPDEVSDEILLQEDNDRVSLDRKPVGIEEYIRKPVGIVSTGDNLVVENHPTDDTIIHSVKEEEVVAVIESNDVTKETDVDKELIDEDEEIIAIVNDDHETSIVESKETESYSSSSKLDKSSICEWMDIESLDEKEWLGIWQTENGEELLLKEDGKAMPTSALGQIGSWRNGPRGIEVALQLRKTTPRGGFGGVSPAVLKGTVYKTQAFIDGEPIHFGNESISLNATLTTKFLGTDIESRLVLNKLASVPTHTETPSQQVTTSSAY